LVVAMDMVGLRERVFGSLELGAGSQELGARS
jgi:hypothetical protein